MAEPPPTQPVAPPAPAPVPPPPTNPVGAVASAATNRASINPAFRYLGIPPSVLAWRPRVPSRNVSIFLTVTVSLTSLYVYDRRECKRLKQEYLGKVRHLARERVGGATEGVPDWMPRKVTVYGARVPEDVDVDRGAQWFKKYVKPMLIAAAIDYKIVNGVQPGGLGRKVAEEIHDRRIVEAAQEKDRYVEPAIAPGGMGFREWSERQRRNEGGSLILGRGSLKEYLWGLRRGYLDPVPLDTLDVEERLAKHFESDPIFDETERPSPSSSSSEFATPNGDGNPGEAFGYQGEDDDIPAGLRSVQEDLARGGSDDDVRDWDNVPSPSYAPHSSPPQRKGFLSSLFGTSSKSKPPAPSTSDLTLADSGPLPPKELPPVDRVPPQPPLLLVPFDHPIGMKWWPLKLYGFFRHRDRVRAGADVALALIAQETEDLVPPSTGSEGLSTYRGDQGLADDALVQGHEQDAKQAGPTGSPHLDFLLDTEPHIRRSYNSLPSVMVSSRTDYLSTLPEKLKTARDLARGVREPTKDETKFPPPTEVDLRAERLKKEQKWREDRQGWEVVRKGSGVAWDERMEGALKVFVQGDKARELKERKVESDPTEEPSKDESA